MMIFKSKAMSLCFSTLPISLCVLLGCGGKNEQQEGGSGGNGESQGPVVRDADTSLLDDFLPPVDGLVEVAPPKDWKIKPRQSPYLVQFSGSAARINPLPRIRITANPSSFDSPNVSKNNLSDFLSHIEAQLKETDKERYLREPPVAMIIGGRPCVRFVLAGRMSITSTRTLSIETQRLVTVVGGKQYDFDLQVVEGQIPDYRDQSYAVFGGTKFLKESSEPAPSPEKKENAPEESDATKQE